GTGNKPVDPIGAAPAIYGTGANVTLNGTNLIADENGNRAFVIENGATIVSQKEMIVNKNFDVADFGGGRFVMGSYAKLSASNVSGDIYLAPDMVPLYENFGTIKNAITQNASSNESNWFKANLKSYSEFFVAKDVTYDETGKAVNLNLERKSFDTVLADKNLAKYLEDNYTNTNSSNKDKFYDGILRATNLTAAQTEDKIKNMFGVEFYPAYQNLVYDLTSYNNKMIFDNYATLDYEKEGTSPIVGIETRNFDFKGVDNKLQGYKGNENSMFVGFDTFGTKNFRFGGLAMINQSNATFENKSKFENTYFYQANIYFAYKLESSKVDFFLSPYVGTYNGDITRIVDGNNIEAVGTGKYFGSLARVNRNFDLGFMYILPEVQFDYGQNQQDEINEITGTTTNATAVNFKSNSTTKSNVLGALKFGKIFYLGNELKLDASLRGDYSKELGDPIGDVNVQVAGAENGSYTINNYTKIGAESNAIVRVALSKPFFSVYAEYAYALAGDRTTGGTVTGGLQYKFNY
ncbi:MAG: autotransporter outer membrane beta-barrel domain-containing protein, partial [Fusobacteriaceae bacterium]